MIRQHLNIHRSDRALINIPVNLTGKPLRAAKRPPWSIWWCPHTSKASENLISFIWNETSASHLLKSWDFFFHEECWPVFIKDSNLWQLSVTDKKVMVIVYFFLIYQDPFFFHSRYLEYSLGSRHDKSVHIYFYHWKCSAISLKSWDYLCKVIHLFKKIKKATKICDVFRYHS